jgi:hypothetical protein
MRWCGRPSSTRTARSPTTGASAKFDAPAKYTSGEPVKIWRTNRGWQTTISRPKRGMFTA